MRLIDADKMYIDTIPTSYAGNCTIEDVGDWIESQPTVDPVIHTKREPATANGDIWRCGNCKCPIGSVNYCPRCGAKIDL